MSSELLRNVLQTLGLRRRLVISKGRLVLSNRSHPVCLLCDCYLLCRNSYATEGCRLKCLLAVPTDQFSGAPVERKVQVLTIRRLLYTVQIEYYRSADRLRCTCVPRGEEVVWKGIPPYLPQPHSLYRYKSVCGFCFRARPSLCQEGTKKINLSF